MDTGPNDTKTQEASGADLRGLIRSVLEEVTAVDRQRSEPAYKVELSEERKRRESLEKRVNELIEENKRSRAVAEETDRSAQIRAELQRLGVQKVDLAFKVVRDEIRRSESGDLVAKTGEGDQGLRDYLTRFVSDNPEFLPPRIAGGTGSSSATQKTGRAGTIEIERIRPGMSQEELQRVRDQIAFVASQSLRGE